MLQTFAAWQLNETDIPGKQTFEPGHQQIVLDDQ